MRRALLIAGAVLIAAPVVVLAGWAPWLGLPLAVVLALAVMWLVARAGAGRGDRGAP